MSENSLGRWMEKYNAIIVGDYVRRSQPLPGPFADAREMYFFRGASSWLRRVAERRQAEERERQEWLSDVKRRYGLVCTGDMPPYRVPWPGGILGGSYEVISDHTLELHIEWPPECRCVLLDGEQVSLGGPCPVHAASRWARGRRSVNDRAGAGPALPAPARSRIAGAAVSPGPTSP